MKRLISMLIILSMTCALFPFAIPASANPLPGDTVVVVTTVTGLNDLDDILDKRRAKA